MPSFDTFKKMNGGVRNNGQARKVNADMIIENTWEEDIQSKIAYFYDHVLDDQPLLYKDLDSEKSKTKVPIEIKFIVAAHNSDSKDQVSYKIMFKPSFRWQNLHSLDFYKERFERRYGAEFPIGLECDIPDEKGIYRKWVVTAEASKYDNQFPTWYILPCDHLFQWVVDGKLYQYCGVSRSQNSYNSGVWQSRGGEVQTTIPENQNVAWFPMNEITSTIFYDLRIVKSAPIKTPIVWKVSKVDNTNPKGITHFTFSQDRWNEHTDAFYYDIDKKHNKREFTHEFDLSRPLLGIYADYYSTNITPTEYKPETRNVYGKITYNSQPEIKVGGGYKKFTVTFYQDDKEITLPNGTWSFEKDGADCSDLLEIIYSDNIAKVKFVGNDSYIGSVVTIKYTTEDNDIAFVDTEVVGL